MPTVLLECHPATPSAHVHRVGVRAILRGGLLLLRYSLRGDLARLRIPAPRASERAHKLWEHTCFEAFLKAEDAASYWELNVSPSTQWALYRFSDYRQGMSPLPWTAPRAIRLRRTDAGVDLAVGIALEGLAHGENRPLRVGLSAVIEPKHGEMSYWALAHPRGQPDFHDPEGFRLQLPPSTHQPGCGHAAQHSPMT